MFVRSHIRWGKGRRLEAHLTFVTPVLSTGVVVLYLISNLAICSVVKSFYSPPCKCLYGLTWNSVIGLQKILFWVLSPDPLSMARQVSSHFPMLLSPSVLLQTPSLGQRLAGSYHAFVLMFSKMSFPDWCGLPGTVGAESNSSPTAGFLWGRGGVGRVRASRQVCCLEGQGERTLIIFPCGYSF